MRLSSLPRLRCPACVTRGVESAFDLDAVRVGGREDGGVAGDFIEGYLVCRACREAFPVLGGVPVLPRDLVRHLQTHGNVYRRTPIADPRVTRYVLGHARNGEDFVPFPEVVAHYADLLPADPTRPASSPAPVDAALDEALLTAGARGPALDVGCGVGRGTFVLAARTGDALGIDRSVARVRRARNVRMAEQFSLPAPGAPSGDEIPLDLGRLARDAADFLVADSGALPFPAGAFATVVLRSADGEGAFPDRAAARREAERVLAPGGTLLLERERAAGIAPAFDAVRVGHAPATVP